MPSNRPTLLEEELALLMAPVSTTGVHSLTRVINAGEYLDIAIPNIQMTYCSTFEELILTLVSNTDIDAIILSGEHFSNKDFWLLTPLLSNLEQARLFVHGAVPQMIPDFPDFEYYEDADELLVALIDWHQHLREGFYNWIEQGKIAVSDSHQHDLPPLLPEINRSAFVPISQLAKNDYPLMAIITCSSDNSQICEEIEFLAQHSPKLPLILINQNKPHLIHTVHHLALELNLNVLAITDKPNKTPQLQAITIRYYRRYLRWLNHHFDQASHAIEFVYQLNQETPIATFQWPPKKFLRIHRFYVKWQQICSDGYSDDLASAYETLREVYHFDYSQMTVVFEGKLPETQHLTALARLLARNVEICWIPSSLTQLLQTREQIGISQILIPLKVWLEFVADDQRLVTWQQRYQQRQIKIGLLGAHRELLRFTEPLDFQLMAEPKKPTVQVTPDY